MDETGPLAGASRSWVQYVPQGVAQEVKAHHQQRDSPTAFHPS